MPSAPWFSPAIGMHNIRGLSAADARSAWDLDDRCTTVVSLTRCRQHRRLASWPHQQHARCQCRTSRPTSGRSISERDGAQASGHITFRGPQPGQGNGPQGGGFRRNDGPSGNIRGSGKACDACGSHSHVSPKDWRFNHSQPEFCKAFWPFGPGVTDAFRQYGPTDGNNVALARATWTARSKLPRADLVPPGMPRELLVQCLVPEEIVVAYMREDGGPAYEGGGDPGYFQHVHSLSSGSDFLGATNVVPRERRSPAARCSRPAWCGGARSCLTFLSRASNAA